MKLFLLACVFALSASAHAGSTPRKIASVIGKDQKTLEKMAIELAKVYSAPKKGTTFNFVNFTKEDGKTVVKVESNYFDKKEQVGATCGFTITFEAPVEDNGDRGNGSVLVESGLCFS